MRNRNIFDSRHAVGAAGKDIAAQVRLELANPKRVKEHHRDQARVQEHGTHRWEADGITFIEDVAWFVHGLIRSSALTRIERRRHHFHVKLGFAEGRNHLCDGVPRCLLIGAHIDRGRVAESPVNGVRQQIAAACVFANPNHFCKVFSPKAYRRTVL